MTDHDFNLEFSRLEVLFNGGLNLPDTARLEYYEAFRYYDAEDFRQTIGLVAKSFRPQYSEKFPSIATLMDALSRVREASESTSARQAEERPADGELDYCQACRNTGIVLGDDDVARPCVCPKGRVIAAAWQVPAGDPDRQSKIDGILASTPLSAGPVRGLREKGPDGHWQDTAEEHGRKMAAARLRYAQFARVRNGGRPLARAVAGVMDDIGRAANISGKDRAVGPDND